MKVYNYNKFPEGYCVGEDAIEPLGEGDIQSLENLGISNVYYWYASGSYEGSGQMLCKKDNLWFLHDMGHCSCYGPIDNLLLAPNNGCSSLRELKSKCTDELFKQIEPLFNKAKKDEKQ